MIAAQPGRARWGGLGPGIVFLLTAVGPGDLVSNVAAGASHGYALLWVLPVALVFRYAWLSTSARYVLITGETLISGFARYGRGPLWLTLGGLAVIRHLSNLTKLVLLGSTAHVLLPLPTPHSMAVWATALTLAGYLLMVRGGYGPIERLCKALAFGLGVLLVATAVVVRPSISGIARGLLVPSAPADAGLYTTALLVMALVGTESGSLTNITYSYFVREKGWRGVRDLGAQRVDLAIGVAGLLLAGVLLQVVAAATLHGTGTTVQSVDDLSRAFSTRFGELGLTVFAAGLLGKTFAGFVGGTTGYALVASDIWRRLDLGGRGSDEGSDRRHDRTYRVAIALLALPPLYVVLTGWKPVILALVSSAAMAALIPLLAIGLLVLGNDQRRLGEHANGWPANTLIVTLTVIAVWLIMLNTRELLRGVGL